MLQRIYQHLVWADTRVLGALQDAVDPPADALRVFAHVLGAEVIWVDRVEGKPQSIAVWPESSISELPALMENVHSRLQRVVSTDDPERMVAYTNSAGMAFETSVMNILTHVALHGTYHRGQVSSRLRAAGADPAPTDFIAFVRGSPAATHPIDL